MTSPIPPLAHTITQDRIRKAEAARLARGITQEAPRQPQRRFRTLAARLSPVTR